MYSGGIGIPTNSPEKRVEGLVTRNEPSVVLRDVFMKCIGNNSENNTGFQENELALI